MPIAKKFGASFFDMEAVKFFSSFVESAMDERKAGDKVSGGTPLYRCSLTHRGRDEMDNIS